VGSCVITIKRRHEAAGAPQMNFLTIRDLERHRLGCGIGERRELPFGNIIAPTFKDLDGTVLFEKGGRVFGVLLEFGTG
jgi:hypothetical protein